MLEGEPTIGKGPRLSPFEKSTAFSRNVRFVIAHNSPSEDFETGLPISPPEKSTQRRDLKRSVGHSLWSDFKRRSAELR